MKKLYCSRDSVSGIWQDPQAFNCDADAKRSFSFALASASIPDCYMKDIDLYCVGNFDDTCGRVTFCDPVHIVNGYNEQTILYCDWIFNRNEEVNNEISKEEACN